MIEVWKDVKGFEGLYQVSDMGRVRSLDRKIKNPGCIAFNFKGRVLRAALSPTGYLIVGLSKNKKTSTKAIHQLVAITFLDHKPNGQTMVCNHINFDRTDNRLSNIEIVTARENGNKKHLKSSSKYTGVCLVKGKKRWVSHITIKGKLKSLGQFKSEIEAHEAYQKALKSLLGE